MAITSDPSKPPKKAVTHAKIAQLDFGLLGEKLVAQWLEQQGWQILEQRWRCRWGEIDLIAHYRPPASQPKAAILAFVEVKSRSQGNWDADGLLAVTAQKQAKLWRTAQIFLARHPQLAELPCRFDVALVQGKSWPHRPADFAFTEKIGAEKKKNQGRAIAPIHLGQPVICSGYQLSLQHYIPAAFTEG